MTKTTLRKVSERVSRTGWGTALLLAALALALLGVTACGGQEQESSQGGTLTAALSSDPGQLNPAITTQGGVHEASEILYNGLVSVDDDLEPVPDLAESWEIEDDGATYRFTLRDGVTWHDGEPFTSDDVRFSFEEALTELHSRTAASVGRELESIETPDERTVVFNFERPYAPFLRQLDVTEAPIIPAHLYEGTDLQSNPANTEPVGTGPFRFVSYEQGSEIRLTRNEGYFKEDLPYLDEVVLRIIPDQATQISALESGEVDWVGSVPAPDRDRLQETSGIETIDTNRGAGGSNCIMTMSFNLERPILQDGGVRRAISHAVDQQQFLDQVLFGAGRVAEAPISSNIPEAHATGLDMPEFDSGETERLLDEVGWRDEGGDTRVARGVEGVSDGTPLTLNFVHFTTFNRYGELMRQQLGEVGIDLELVPMEPQAFPERVFEDRDFDTNIISYCNGLVPESGVNRMYTTSSIGPAPFSNAAAYSNPGVDSLFEQSSQATDEDERSETYREIQEILVEDLPYFWVVETLSTRAHTDSCSGFNPNYGQFAEAAYCMR
jgi:peptide/nickel transport system substrate-binding protein